MKLDHQAVQAAMANRGWSARELAEASGIGLSQLYDILYRIKRGNGVWTKTAGRIARALEVNCKELMASE